VPFLPEFAAAKDGNSFRSKLAFGYSFLEKFLQLSVRVPIQSDPQAIKIFLESLTSSDRKPVALLVPKPGSGAVLSNVSTPLVGAAEIDYQRIETGEESERIRDVVLMVSPVFGYNPRRIKQFLNSYRLSVYLASSQGLLDINRKDGRSAVTLEQLGKFIALTIRLPELIDLLTRNPNTLAEYESAAIMNSPGRMTNTSSMLSDVQIWLRKEDAISDLLMFGLDMPEKQKYMLDRFPVEKMLSAIPLAPRPPEPSAAGTPLTQSIAMSFSETTTTTSNSAQSDPGAFADVKQESTNAVVSVHYETTGTGAQRVNIFVRAGQQEGWYRLESSTGVTDYGPPQAISIQLFALDRDLISKGYKRMNFANRSGISLFDLF
jgi:hypothetical protein